MHDRYPTNDRPLRYVNPWDEIAPAGIPINLDSPHPLPQPTICGRLLACRHSSSQTDPMPLA
jgi:hypothetical protein